MDSEDIEIDVIPGYRAGGIVILVCCLTLMVLFAKPTHLPGTEPASPLPYLLTMVPLVALGLYLCLAVSRIRFSPQGQRAVLERGVWPFVSRRTEDVSGEKRLVVRAYRGSKGSRLVVVDLELADGQRIPILRNVSMPKFDALAEAAPKIGARFALTGPADAVPDWIKDRIVRDRFERLP